MNTVFPSQQFSGIVSPFCLLTLCGSGSLRLRVTLPELPGAQQASHCRDIVRATGSERQGVEAQIRNGWKTINSANVSIRWSNTFCNQPTQAAR